MVQYIVKTEKSGSRSGGNRPTSSPSSEKHPSKVLLCRESNPHTSHRWIPAPAEVVGRSVASALCPGVPAGWGINVEASADINITHEHEHYHREGVTHTHRHTPGEHDHDEKDQEVDNVNHPVHYNAHPSGVECIDITEHFNFNIGNAVKYLWRQGLKGDSVEDLKKAEWYVRREIERLEGKAEPGYEVCGARTFDNKHCMLPQGHNVGRPDLPQNHSSVRRENDDRQQ